MNYCIVILCRCTNTLLYKLSILVTLKNILCLQWGTYLDNVSVQPTCSTVCCWQSYASLSFASGYILLYIYNLIIFTFGNGFYCLLLWCLKLLLPLYCSHVESDLWTHWLMPGCKHMIILLHHIIFYIYFNWRIKLDLYPNNFFSDLLSLESKENVISYTVISLSKILTLWALMLTNNSILCESCKSDLYKL